MAEQNPLGAQIMEALARGDKLTAIKLARQARNGSLKDAVEFVESHATPAARAAGARILDKAADVVSQHGQHVHAQSMQHALKSNNRRPTVVMGDAPGSLRWVMIALGLLALAAWLGFG